MRLLKAVKKKAPSGGGSCARAIGLHKPRSFLCTGAQEQGENSVCELVVVLGTLLGSHHALRRLDAACGAGGTRGRLRPSSDAGAPILQRMLQHAGPHPGSPGAVRGMGHASFPEREFHWRVGRGLGCWSRSKQIAVCKAELVQWGSGAGIAGDAAAGLQRSKS